MRKRTKLASEVGDKKENPRGKGRKITGRDPVAILIPLDRTELSESQWSKVAATTILPEDARFKICMAISSYKGRMESVRTPLASKRLLASSRKGVEKLSKQLTVLSSDRAFRMAGRFQTLSNFEEDQRTLEAAHAVLENLDLGLKNAEERLNTRRGRKSSEPLRQFILELMQIQAQATGKPLSSSGKTGRADSTNLFVTACVRVAEPSLPKSRIRAALIKCISQHHRARKFGFDTARDKWLEEDN